MLNRYGLVDVDLTGLVESDQRLRNLERKFKESGAPDDRAAYERELERMHGRDAAHHMLLKPHIEALEAATHEKKSVGKIIRDAHAADRYVEGGEHQANQKRLAELSKTHRKAVKKVNFEAKRLGRHGGEFITRREGESEDDHHDRLADMAAENVPWRRPPRMMRPTFSFGNTRSARHFHQSMIHHYPARTPMKINHDNDRLRTAVVLQTRPKKT
jgi:hypothetical protein